MRENPKPYEIYRHFKGNLYQILTLAQHSEDGRTMVVYQALYGDYRVYVRSLDMFMSLTDTEKYPDITQKYRFERIDPEMAAGNTQDGTQNVPQNAPQNVPQKSSQSVPQNIPQNPVSTFETPKAETPIRESAARTETAAGIVETTGQGKMYEAATETQQPSGATVELPDLDPGVLEFLDADTYQQKLNILASMKHRITDDMINTLAIASDLEVEPGPIEKRYDSLKNCLLMKDRFEKVRLF